MREKENCKAIFNSSKTLTFVFLASFVVKKSRSCWRAKAKIPSNYRQTGGFVALTFKTNAG